MRWWLVGVLAIAACPRPRPEPDKPVPPAGEVPALTVTAPERGTFVEGAKIAVTGRARGRVTVNGVAAALAPDGTFSVELAVTRGLTIIETHAIDAAGHDVRDVRAVLAGPFAPTDGSTRATFGARLGRDGLAAVGNALAGSAKAIDFAAAAKALNPVYQKGGCLGVKVDIADLTVGKIEVALAAKAGAIDTTVSVDDIAVRLDVRYEVACIGGMATMTVRTKAYARGDLAVALRDRRIQTALRPMVVLDDFQLDTGGLPRPIEAILRTGVRVGVERAIVDALERKVPPLVDAKLAELLARPLVPLVLGRELKLDVAPRALEIAPNGLFLAADAALIVAGGERGRYVTRSAAIGPAGLGVWLAADAVNQLFAGLWASRAFERTIDRNAVGPLSLLLDGSIRTIELSVALPPTVSADGTVELAIGDLMITMRDAAGADLQRFAVSLRSTLSLKPDALVLTTGEPVVHAQLLSQSAAITRPLDAAGVEGIVKGAWALVDTMIGDALSRVPIPGLAGLETRSLIGRDGFIVLDVAAKAK